MVRAGATVSRDEQRESDTPVDGPPLSERGQFWNIDRSVRGAATGAGLAGGSWFAFIDPYDLEEIVNSFLGGDWFVATCVVTGGVLGFVGASLKD